MLIATDGACRRQGTPECAACGVAWVQEEYGKMYFLAKYETRESSSQRGELMGLLAGLECALEKASADEDVIIVTDSEYLFNSVFKEWLWTWQRSNWQGATGPVKNVDLWAKALELIEKIGKERIVMMWTKGHLVSYTPALVKRAMQEDCTGVELYSRILAVATRQCQQPIVVNSFNKERERHGHAAMPEDIALDCVVANVTADSLASFIMASVDAKI